MFELTLREREQLKLVKAGDRVAIITRSRRVYVETVASVMDDRIIVPRREYHIHNGRSHDPFCGDTLRGLATEHDLVKTQAHAKAAKQKRDVQKQERERRRDEELAEAARAFVAAHAASCVPASLGILPGPLVAGCPLGIRSAHDKRRVRARSKTPSHRRKRHRDCS
jgi:hypothetical protein